MLQEIQKHHEEGVFKEWELISLVENGFYDEDSLRDALNDLVKQNFLYYNPTRAQYKLPGRGMELGLDGYVKMFEEFF